MQTMRSLVYIFLLLGGVVTLPACGDKREEGGKEVVPVTEGQKTTQSVTQTTLNTDACDTYFAQMQSCVNSQITQQDQQRLETSLSFLKQQIKQLDDQEQIAKICQKSLDTIEEQKKQIGCI